MKSTFDWVKAIGIVLLIFASLYAIWILAILMAIGMGVFMVKSFMEDEP